MKLSEIIKGLVIVGAMGGAASADAQTFDQTHPRRAEVNDRLANQHARINQGVRDGQLDHRQARQLRADDRSIREEERADASAHGGHINRAEQRQINRQENANSRAIYGDKHD